MLNLQLLLICDHLSFAASAARFVFWYFMFCIQIVRTFYFTRSVSWIDRHDIHYMALCIIFTRSHYPQVTYHARQYTSFHDQLFSISKLSESYPFIANFIDTNIRNNLILFHNHIALA